MANILNIPALQQMAVSESPYPHMVIPNFIRQEELFRVVANFPEIINRGSIPVGSVECTPIFQKFIDELEGSELRKAISEKFAMNLNDKPTMLTLRGYTNERDGHIHTDSKSKLITILIYMNSAWDSEGGRLRLLKNEKNLDDFVAEVSPVAGTAVIFKVTDNCWHGHKVFVGKRLSMQLNYLADDAALTKHLSHHRITAKLKKWFPKLYGHHEVTS